MAAARGLTVEEETRKPERALSQHARSFSVIEKGRRCGIYGRRNGVV